MERIFHKKKLVGIKIKSLKPGTHPISEPLEPLQLVALRHKKGSVIRPHRHKPVKRVTSILQECLVVVAGKVRVNLYGGGTTAVASVLVKAGEAFVTVSGGHSVEFLENSKVLELKNGPFKDDRISL